MISKQRLQQQLAALKEITAPGRGINRAGVHGYGLAGARISDGADA